MAWRQTRTEQDLAKLSASEAMFNRAALNPATLRIHSRMVREGANRSKDGGLVAGCLTTVLVKEFAQEAGKPTPDTLQAAADFLRSELKGYDTAEARERRERAVGIELVRDVTGDTSMKEFGAALDKFVLAALRQSEETISSHLAFQTGSVRRYRPSCEAVTMRGRARRRQAAVAQRAAMPPTGARALRD